MPRSAQDESCATWAARRAPKDGLIDWRRPAEEVLRLIRAVGHPYPGAFTRLADADLRVWAAVPSGMGGRHSALPGQIILRTPEDFTVMCGQNSALTITQWSGIEKPPPLHVKLGE
jgi:methionyl-tRNA formyltransferase